MNAIHNLGQILRHEVAPLVHEAAGQGVAHLTVQEPVAEIMGRLVREADQVLADLGTARSASPAPMRPAT